MSDGPLLNDVTRAFAETHRNEDVRDLALKTKRTADLDLPAALDQIAGWQIARNKLPQWAACADIVYPAHISMEQCSSQFTAQYKAEIARRLLRSLPQSAGQTANDATMTDLTGGFGVDFSYLARGFGHATYVERQSHLCELAAHNMAALGLTQAQVVCGDGVEYLRAMEPVQLIYIDPARRDEHGARTYAIEDCTPDVLALRDLLLAKARYVMIKLSPMLDWRKAVDDFAGTVAEVHIVSTGNECKELLLVLDGKVAGITSDAAAADTRAPHVYCVNDDQRLDYDAAAYTRGLRIGDAPLPARAALPVRAERVDHEGRLLRRGGSAIRGGANRPEQPPVRIGRAGRWFSGARFCDRNDWRYGQEGAEAIAVRLGPCQHRRA